MKISFLTSAHSPLDDRIFYHQAKALFENGDELEIVSSIKKQNQTIDGVRLNCFSDDNLSKTEKINSFVEKLDSFKPDTIICSEPITILSAKNYKKSQSKKIKIIYDITEWYPSKKNLADYSIPLKSIQFFKFLMFNFFICFYVDAFIFGEYYKSRPYRFLFPFKKYSFTTYYPDLKYIPHKKPDLQNNLLRLSYSGKISIEKGFKNFVAVLKELSNQHQELKIELKIISWFDKKDEEYCKQLIESLPSNISIKYYAIQKLEKYLELISDSDFFLDLRSTDFENQRCLPIKLFYFAALGRPIIYSKLKSISKEVEINKFGQLHKPSNTKAIVNFINSCIDDKQKYFLLCENARKLAETRYNWEKIKSQFVRFVHN